MDKPFKLEIVEELGAKVAGQTSDELLFKNLCMKYFRKNSEAEFSLEIYDDLTYVCTV